MARLALAALLLLLLATPAAAGSFAACALAHEEAHCCGWPGNHPQGTFWPGCGRIIMPPRGLYTKDCKAMTIERLDVSRVASLCLGNAVACSHVHRKTCRIIINRAIQ